jgi:Peptidase M10 serralysin C terminal/FecR protein
MLRSVDDFDGQHFAFHAADAVPDESKTVISIDDNPNGPTATIPDAHLLFNAEFKRAGTDLILTGDDGKTATVHDYFASDKHPTLLSPEGAALAPDVVAALAGPLAAGQYAQATAAQTNAQAVGRVAVVSGNATILRNGVAITVASGDAVLKGDVLQTGSGNLGVTFNDGSTLNLTANSRLVVNEFVFDPHGTANSEILNLVQGSLTFISGQVAHTGDMKIGTPVATMGIRGTVGGVTNSDDGTAHFYVSQSATGAVILDQNDNVIANVVQDGPLIIVRPVGQLQVLAEEVLKTPQELATELAALQHIVNVQAIGQQIIQQYFQQDQNNPNPQSNDHPHTQFQIFLPNNLANSTDSNGNTDNATATVQGTTIITNETNGGTTTTEQIFYATVPLPVGSLNFAPVLSLGGSATILDQFTTQAYGAWTELGDDFAATNGSPTAGDFTLAHDPLASTGNFQIRLADSDAETAPPDLLSRTVNLSAATSALLTFDYRRDIPSGQADDQFLVLASSDGVNFTQIGQIGATGDGSFVDPTYQTFTFDLTPYISANTTIRFSVGDNVDNGDVVYVDNIKVVYVDNINITSVTAAPPAIDLTVTYTENGAPVPIGALSQITDVDDTSMSSAAITLTNPRNGDSLAVSNLAALAALGILVSSADASHINLAGSASTANYEAALKLITFSNSSNNPDTSDRIIDITVTDGHGSVSNTATETVHVTALDSAPVATHEHIITNVALGTAFQVPDWALLANDSDPDNPHNQLAVIDAFNGVDGTASHSSGMVTLTDTGTANGSFDYTISDGSLTATGHDTFGTATGSINGSSHGDILIGNESGTTINGNGGNDIFIGNGGGDTLNGGSGNDTFVFNAVTDSAPGTTSGHPNYDTISNFTPGQDKVDLSAIDASTAAGIQHFTFVDNATPTVNPGVQANSITWYQDTSHNETIILADVTGNATPEVEIHLTGVVTLHAQDFILT